jgi:hypothetical protein
MIGLDGFINHTLLKTISAIYDCALDPQQWPDTARRPYREVWANGPRHLRARSGHTQNNQLLVRLPAGIPGKVRRELRAQSDGGDTSRRSARSTSFRWPAPVSEGRFAREVLKPFGLRDHLVPGARTGRVATLHPGPTARRTTSSTEIACSTSRAVRLPRARHLRCARHRALRPDAGKPLDGHVDFTPVSRLSIGRRHARRRSPVETTRS